MKPHPVLFPFSLIYGLVVSLRNLCFDIGLFPSVDVGVPVISIGNITAGGSGKTPMVQNVASILLDAGKSVAIVSRGYGRDTTGPVVVCDGKNILTDAKSSGDEPMMIAQKLKTATVIVDENRVRGSRKAVVEFGADMIILDDGFQHRGIKRTKNIVVMDAGHMPLDTMLLPAGYRREPICSMKRADAIMVTNTGEVQGGKTISDGLKLDGAQKKFSSSYRPSGIKHVFGSISQSLENLKGHSAVVFCGIANPERFENTLVSCGVQIKKSLKYSDHHSFTASEIESIIALYHESKADFILTTEKDAVRLKVFEEVLKNIPISALTMDVSIHQPAEWKRYLLS